MNIPIQVVTSLAVLVCPLTDIMCKNRYLYGPNLWVLERISKHHSILTALATSDVYKLLSMSESGQIYNMQKHRRLYIYKKRYYEVLFMSCTRTQWCYTHSCHWSQANSLMSCSHQTIHHQEKLRKLEVSKHECKRCRISKYLFIFIFYDERYDPKCVDQHQTQ